MLNLLKDRRQKALEKAQKELFQIIDNLKKAGIENLQEPTGFEGPDKDEPLKVVIFGEYNAGKSSLINALLGKDIAETGSLPTTDHIVEYVYSKEEKRVLLGERVQIGLKEETLRKYVLVDLPGTNSAVERHERTVRDYINRADLVLFCSRADQTLKSTELQLIRKFIEDGRKMLFLLTRADLLEKEEIEQVKVFVETKLHEIFGKRVPVLAVSAKRYREEGSEEGMSRLMEYIEAQARELEGEKLREYRDERWFNTLLNHIELYKERLWDELSAIKEQKEECYRKAHYLQERWKSVEDWIESEEESLLRYADGLGLTKALFFFTGLKKALFFLKFLKLFDSSVEDHLKREYEEFVKNLSRSVKGYFEEAARLFAVEDLPQVKINPDGEKFVKNFSRSIVAGYVALLFLGIMLIASAQSLVVKLLSADLSSALFGVLVWIGFIILLAVSVYKIAKGWLTKAYVKYNIWSLKTYLSNRNKKLMKQIQTECRKTEERERLVENALKKMQVIKTKLEKSHEIS